MEHRKVSVVVPMYNSGKFIHHTLTAVFQSTYPDYEVILVDDGSADDTPRVLARNGWMERATYLRQENKGIAGARNTGIRATSGRYVSLLDHDDLPLPGKLAKLVAYLEANPRYGMVYTPVIRKGEHVDGRRSGPAKNDRLEGDLFESIYRRNYIMTSSTLIERSCLMDIGLYDEEYKLMEDVELYLRFCTKYRIGYVDEPLTVYSWRYDNTSVRWQDKTPDYEHKMYVQYYGELKKKTPHADRIFRSAMGNVHRSKARIALKGRDSGAFVRHSLMAIRNEPFRLKNYARCASGLIRLWFEGSAPAGPGSDR